MDTHIYKFSIPFPNLSLLLILCSRIDSIMRYLKLKKPQECSLSGEKTINVLHLLHYDKKWCNTYYHHFCNVQNK